MRTLDRATKGDALADTQSNAKAAEPNRRTNTKANACTDNQSNAKADEGPDARAHTAAALWPRPASRGQARWRHRILPTMQIRAVLKRRQ